MTAVTNLLDKYRKVCSLKSDNALAISLGLTRQSVFQWRKGIAWPTDDHVTKMASDIGDDSGSWLVAVAAERTTGPAHKEWLQLAKRLASATGAVLAMTLALPVKADTAQRLDVQMTSAPQLQQIDPGIHYAKW